MVKKVVCVKWGYLYTSRLVKIRYTGVRATIRATKLGNASRAKGCREIDTL
jgi:hypothetical protein